jgi:hypothetical protein
MMRRKMKPTEKDMAATKVKNEQSQSILTILIIREVQVKVFLVLVRTAHSHVP